MSEQAVRREPPDILNRALVRATEHLAAPIMEDSDVLARVDFVCRCISNRAGVRLLMACLLAKLHQPQVDIRRPHTGLGGEGAYSGRTYDEQHVWPFAVNHRLPVNRTSAFLTPSFRNLDRPLTTDLDIVGRPALLYAYLLQLLDDVSTGRVAAADLLAEVIRSLLVIREERDNRMATLLASLRQPVERLLLSAEEIVSLIEQHLQCRNASRLPVLVVAAAYQVATNKLGERPLSLMPHTAADTRTGSLGDVEITLVNDDQVITSYEMKDRRLTIDDIEQTLQKLTEVPNSIDNYIFITTDIISEETKAYADSLYKRTGGTEFAILDCIGFLRHFLHLFHRLRLDFLDAYQKLLLAEPDSAVSQPLKEAFLALRLAAESDE